MDVSVVQVSVDRWMDGIAQLAAMVMGGVSGLPWVKCS